MAKVVFLIGATTTGKTSSLFVDKEGNMPVLIDGGYGDLDVEKLKTFNEGFDYGSVWVLDTDKKKDLPIQKDGKLNSITYTMRSIRNRDDINKFKELLIKGCGKGVKNNIKIVLVDTLNGIMSNLTTGAEFKSRNSKGEALSRYTDLSEDIFSLYNELPDMLRDDVILYFVWHTEFNTSTATHEIKHVGSNLKKLGISETVNVILDFRKDGDNFYVLTKGSGSIAKAPYGMFPEEIPNSLHLIDSTIRKYYKMS